MFVSVSLSVWVLFKKLLKMIFVCKTNLESVLRLLMLLEEIFFFSPSAVRKFWLVSQTKIAYGDF